MTRFAKRLTFGLPEVFVERLLNVVPKALHADVLASFVADKPFAVWLNPLVADPATTQARLEVLAREHSANVQILGPNVLVAEGFPSGILSHSEPVCDGSAYLISPSSLLPVWALAVEPADRVLDLCAAPGGKTVQLAAALGLGQPTVEAPEAKVRIETLLAAPGPLLVAVEAVSTRFYRLQGNLRRLGAGAVRCLMWDGRGVGHAFPEGFDAVLLDAPCSSEARFVADDATTFSHWSPAKVASCAYKQKALLISALTSLRVGGALVYATCSFAPEENEASVLEVLADAAGAIVTEPVAMPALTRPPHLVPGVSGLSDAVRVLPDALWDGFFFVRLKKVAPWPERAEAPAVAASQGRARAAGGRPERRGQQPGKGRDERRPRRIKR